MSREIKFRAWQTNVGDYNKETKEFTPRPTYFYGRDVILDGNGQLLSVESGWDIQGVEEPKDYTLEQYTGLKDKNGKEIYGGDVVKSKNGQRDGFVEYIEDDSGFIVWWTSENEFIYLGEAIRKYEDLEVIGNIHENPELLGGEE